MIWLVGKKGMLGSDVENKLINKKIPYIATGREVDITNCKTLINYCKDKDIKWIVNCAGYTDVDRAEDEKEWAFRLNETGVKNLSKVAKEKDAVIIHISTDYIFDGTKKGKYYESDDPNPLGVYGKSKLAGEKRVTRELSNYYIIRTSWLFGINGNSFVSKIIKLAKKKNELYVVSDQSGNPTYTKDLAECITLIIEHDKKEYGIYNFANNESTTRYDFAKEICRAAKKHNILVKDINIYPTESSKYKTKAKRPKNTSLAIEKVKKYMNIEIQPWKNALEHYMCEYERNEWK